MTLHNFISCLTVCILTVTVFSCKTEPKLTFKVVQLDTTTKAVRISISDLADNYKKYQGQYIETTGNFYEAFEEFAIYTDKNLLTGAVQGFWLDTDKDLSIDNTSFDKMNGKSVTIKGMIDTAHKGHLSSYLATVSRIYYWQQQ
jgi:hypothetical protein